MHDREFGLLYNRMRYLDPVLARFMTTDPARDGMNRYQYEKANPLNKLDHSGMMSVGQCRTFWRDKFWYPWVSMKNIAWKYGLWALYDCQREQDLAEEVLQEGSPETGYFYQNTPQWNKWVEVSHRCSYNKMIAGRAVRWLQGMFWYAKVSRWMIAEGCNCGLLRQVTGTISGAKNGPWKIPSIPTGTDPASLIAWIADEAYSEASQKALERAYKRLEEVGMKLIEPYANPPICCLYDKRYPRREVKFFPGWPGVYTSTNFNVWIGRRASPKIIIGCKYTRQEIGRRAF